MSVAEEGDPCRCTYDGQRCYGVLVSAPDGPCVCAVSPWPPCFACENFYVVCPECGDTPGAAIAGAPPLQGTKAALLAAAKDHVGPYREVLLIEGGRGPGTCTIYVAGFDQERSIALGEAVLPVKPIGVQVYVSPSPEEVVGAHIDRLADLGAKIDAFAARRRL